MSVSVSEILSNEINYTELTSNIARFIEKKQEEADELGIKLKYKLEDASKYAHEGAWPALKEYLYECGDFNMSRIEEDEDFIELCIDGVN